MPSGCRLRFRVLENVIISPRRQSLSVPIYRYMESSGCRWEAEAPSRTREKPVLRFKCLYSLNRTSLFSIPGKDRNTHSQPFFYQRLVSLSFLNNRAPLHDSFHCVCLPRTCVLPLAASSACFYLYNPITKGYIANSNPGASSQVRYPSTFAAQPCVVI